jgi:hypothetical protein
MKRSLFLLTHLLLATHLNFFMSAQAATITLKEGDMGSGEIFTSCVFGDHVESCKFDSGSQETDVVASQFFMSFQSQGSAQQGGASGGSIACDWITLPSLKAAGLTLQKFQVKRCPLPNSVIGINAFQGRTLLLNLDHSSLIASKTPLGLSAQQQQFTFAPFGQMIVPVLSNGQRSQAVWDTGAALSSVDSNFAVNHPEQFTYIQDVPGGTDYTGKPVIMKLYTMKSITIAGVEFNNVDILALDFTPVRQGVGDQTQIIVGYNLIRQMNWSFDLRTQRWAALKRAQINPRGFVQ